MTYKSIRDAIASHEGKKLFCIKSLFLGEETPRTMFVSTELADLISPPWSATSEGRRHARLGALLEGFVEGDFLTVAEDPFDKDASAILARIDPIEEEVWDIRCLDPNPGIRVFGSFTEQDSFVALTFDYRENIDSEDWDDKVVEYKAEWRKLFCNLPPFRGDQLNAYLSYNFRPV